jgi:hypothetical protein
MMLATTTVEDFDRFLKIFSTKGAEKRAQHGSKGSTVFRDPNQDDRVWVLFDWDEEGFQNFVMESRSVLGYLDFGTGTARPATRRRLPRSTSCNACVTRTERFGRLG